MIMKLLVVVVFILASFVVGVFCQSESKVAAPVDLLPPLSRPADCGLAMRYIDDSLNRAFSDSSTIIIIVRMKNIKHTGLARSRSSNLSNYVRFRGFKRYGVVFDLTANESDRVDIFVRGELLYSLPVKQNDKLSLSDC